MTNRWSPGDIIAWRGIYRNRIWHALAMTVVKDSPEEMVLALLPGAERMAEKEYANGRKSGKPRWHFKDLPWELEKIQWRTSRLLILLEPEKYYSIMYFWNNASGEFLYYYINFQVPCQRSHCGVDTLDLDLDLIIHPDFSYEWKDLEEYRRAIDEKIIFPAWTQEIDIAKDEILAKVQKREYPYDGSWLDWVPDPSWSPPKLPENWDKI
jgi:protein associated with RNAse G/E